MKWFRRIPDVLATFLLLLGVAVGSTAGLIAAASADATFVPACNLATNGSAGHRYHAARQLSANQSAAVASGRSRSLPVQRLTTTREVNLERISVTGVAAETATGAVPRFITTGRGVTIDRFSVNSSVSVQRQGRHVFGAREYRGGSYFRSADDAQRVLDDFHSGAAEVLGVKGGFRQASWPH